MDARFKFGGAAVCMEVVKRPYGPKAKDNVAQEERKRINLTMKAIFFSLKK